MKSLLELWRVLAIELSSTVGVNTTLDYEYVKRRFENEGDSFLTITLPTFGETLEGALAIGFFDRHSAMKSFRGLRGSSLPTFLSGFSSRIFDSKSGILLEDPDPEAIFAIRQLTLPFKKIEEPCSEERTHRAFLGYLRTEKEVADFSKVWRNFSLEGDTRVHPYTQLSPGTKTIRLDVPGFERVSLLLFGDLFAKLSEEIYEHKLFPKHGPGATADGLRGNAKFYQREWTTRLEEIFPYGEYCLPSLRFSDFGRDLSEVDFLSPEQERPVKVTTVPKTLKTPRIIAEEPTCMQYMQQAISVRLVELIEDDSILKRLIGFTDQVPNQDLAREGSRKGDLATLDLSEASDRVSNEHVRSLTHSFPWLSKGIDACRSRKARVPAHFGYSSTVIDLDKFASMGSALTFPVEAMTFLTVVVLAIESERGFRFKSRMHLLRELEGVRVYGDDIIVPTRYAVPVMEHLDLFGFKVNASKSFWTGLFRESCGKEYFAGVDVSITRVRRNLPTSRDDVLEVVSLVSLRNRFYSAGQWQASKFLEDYLGQYFPLRLFPAILERSPLLGRVSVLRRAGFQAGDEWDEKLHRPKVKGYVVRSKSPKSNLDGKEALMKFFLKRGKEPLEKDHLERSGRPDAVYIKLRKLCPY